ncbi:hypothetical protein JAAARDRAFT_295606 [Jaapia argillacea MUCL 33604]|uniref:Uncharacterized protein n=1 Tax=Jaapia argillacea MUCL 33604 TaxID=933084 RepID=A0A067PZ98_9AGAM|nr:hypothetical protein JAAARDRAFT_295606 [Jaapia argillacea MUCL 33604]
MAITSSRTLYISVSTFIIRTLMIGIFGEVCGEVGWFKGGRAYQSPTDCYTACFGCISSAIDAGAMDVQCDDYERAADCWMGYPLMGVLKMAGMGTITRCWIW